MNHNQVLSAYLGAFVDELTKMGVEDVVISPGSRSTPLAMLMVENEKIHTYLHVDERSAAFFALGIAKGKRKPVAILCTSGTAAANYYPAVIEAFHSRVPLLVLTADRPHELRNVGAPQAMNQLQLFGSFAKTFIEAALPEGEERMYHYIRTTAARAVSSATSSPVGPVHVNFPLREPLLPDLTLDNLWDYGTLNRPQHVGISNGVPRLSPCQLEYYAELLTQHKKGIIICGSQEESSFSNAVTELAHMTGYPILADPLSGLRSGNHPKENIVECYDTFLRYEKTVEVLQPTLIIRFGAMPISKALTLYTQKQKECVQLVVDGANDWRDPTLLASEMIYCEETAFCTDIIEELSPTRPVAWLKEWQDINKFVKDELACVHSYEEIFEGKVITELQKKLPEKSTFFVGNSMPIRDTDTFYENDSKNITIMANRGVNGIDGIISSALGASTNGEPLVLLIGDLSFYHDLNGLLMAKLYQLNATIVVVNNDGGGIFSFLPQYGEKKHFEALFGTPLGLDYELVVKMYHGTFERVNTWNSFGASVEKGISSKGLHVVEVISDREENLHMHRSLWKKVNDGLSSLLKD